ncbi:MAG: tryptophan synthase subunit alpha [Nitrososphaerota archaeon]|nr:tryptophan synthase subunit alpha [Candidatus Bathyarchaeota archaeon]MDW8022933.1 tryptophan synthase subunit alpha [Nitrososphaerota archaeon]
MELEDKIQILRERREGAHMAHVYYGDPNEIFSISLIKTLAENGADIIEFGIPFSDPIADGATFQAACERALNAGVTPEKCIKGIERLRSEGLKTPIVVTTYFNIPYTMGIEKFLDKIAVAGAHAILVPDLPLEEAKPFMDMAEKRKIHVILQVAPTTSPERRRKILAETSCFTYLIGLEGVTGSRIKGLKAALKLIRNVKETTDKPLLVGFGVSKREHAETLVYGGADGVVVGSAYAKIYAENLENPFQRLPEIAKLAKEIKNGCISGYRKRSTEKLFSG